MGISINHKKCNKSIVDIKIIVGSMYLVTDKTKHLHRSVTTISWQTDLEVNISVFSYAFILIFNSIKIMYS